MKDVVRRGVIAGLLFVGLGAFGLAAYSAVELGMFEPEFRGTVYPDAPAAPAFSLIDHRGAQSSLVDFRGRPVLLFFGYTRCPDVCPLTLAKLARVLSSDALKEISPQVLLVTVDPAFDTPDRLGEYVRSFDPTFVGLTGDSATLASVRAEFGSFATHTTNHSGEPVLAHTDQVFGIDRSGRLRVLIHADAPAETLEHDIRVLARSR